MKRKRRIMLAVFAVMFAMLCMPQRAEAARKAVWKDVDGVWYAYKGSKLVRNKWVGDYYAGSDGSLVKNQWIGEYFVGEDGNGLRILKAAGIKLIKNIIIIPRKVKSSLAGSSSENGSIIWIRRKMVRERPAGEGSRDIAIISAKRRGIC